MEYKNLVKAILLLEDGTQFIGKAVIEGTSFGEVCFNTGMSGYQEIFTDPSYKGQLMVAANVHIGNYGISELEMESEGIKIAGLITRNFSSDFSRVKATDSLFNWLKQQGLVVLTEVDTRAVVQYVRDNGAMNAVITSELDKLDEIKEKLKQIPSMKGLELASKVSTKEPYFVGDENATYKIAALDLGIKKNILRNLAQRDCYIKVFPFDTTFETMQTFNPDGYFLSNGPGDPEPLTNAQEVAKQIIDQNLPLFGICLGHQIIALANGIPTLKMHNGHRGINHPVKNIITGKGEITSQNHGFVVDKQAVELHPDLEITHLHLNDDTLAGMRMKYKNCFSVQYHPEASPGPHDSSYLFDQFIENIQKNK
ncbi:MAG: glutamine-hydrolyzing carbamoyl-phosphate synthase small subunit [Bacteroidetes bacterium]|jgi:carbamoyl-phosphate synthase small subunit|nr:glutamine-hydrolyzing carbamoyl-phosphate synthase small subunit [Bacteroidota bacterium]